MVVVGAGVVGLAIARPWALQGREVVVLEQHSVIGSETSSRNSEVIHAGIYYPPGSLKAKACVRGKQLLYQYCQDHQIPHERIGKLIVATSKAELSQLQHYQTSAKANGVSDLRWLSAQDIPELEPQVVGVAGLYSPSTGIIDSHALMQSLVTDIESNGGYVVANTKVNSLSFENGLRVHTDEMTLHPRILVNAAGLNAAMVSSWLGVHHRLRYARGHYFTMTGPSPFAHLVYPVTEKGGLGIHATLDLARQVRFGPDVQWLDGIDYDFDVRVKPKFVSAIQTYYPGLDPSTLVPGYVGVRPKLNLASEQPADFLVRGPDETGIPGYMELLGIESPGLTSALALAEHVAAIAGG